MRAAAGDPTGVLTRLRTTEIWGIVGAAAALIAHFLPWASFGGAEISSALNIHITSNGVGSGEGVLLVLLLFAVAAALLLDLLEPPRFERSIIIRAVALIVGVAVLVDAGSTLYEIQHGFGLAGTDIPIEPSAGLYTAAIAGAAMSAALALNLYWERKFVTGR